RRRQGELVQGRAAHARLRDDRDPLLLPARRERDGWNSLHRRYAMTWKRCLGFAGGALLSFAFAGSFTLAAAGQKTHASAAAAAAKASPDLVGALSKELGATPEQSAGAAGARFGLAKTRLKPAEFAQVAAAVPGMSALLKAAPSTGGATGTSGALSALAGSAGGLAAAASQFSKLGLSPDLVAKAVPVLTSFVSKSGGASV